MDQETMERKIFELEGKLNRVSNTLLEYSRAEPNAKISDLLTLQRWIEANYMSKYIMDSVFYTKKEADKIFRKRTRLDDILVKKNQEEL